MTTLTIHREHRAPITAVRHDDDELILRRPHFPAGDRDDLRELYAFATGGPTIQGYPATPESPPTGE